MDDFGQYSPHDYALIVSIAYVTYLTIQNRDNRYINDCGEIEIEPRCLAHFLEEYYKCDFNVQERSIIYTEMIDSKLSKAKCQFSIGKTWKLKQSGINTLNDLMDDFIDMNIEQLGKSNTTYH